MYTIPLSGGRPTKVMAGAYEATSPDWSVVSNKVCFSLRYGGQYVIASLDMTKPSAGFKIHTSTAGDWESPSWMGDGRHVLCSRYFNGKKKLYLVDTKFEKQIPLPTNIQASLPDAQ